MERDTWVLWGQRDDHASGQWIRLTGGNIRQCEREQRFRRQHGWETRLRAPGQPALHAAEVRTCPECDSPHHYSHEPGECRHHFA